MNPQGYHQHCGDDQVDEQIPRAHEELSWCGNTAVDHIGQWQRYDQLEKNVDYRGAKARPETNIFKICRGGHSLDINVPRRAKRSGRRDFE